MSDEVTEPGAYDVPLEKLSEKALDPKQSPESQHQALYIPTGTYITVPPMDTRGRVTKAGRTVINVFGTWMGHGGKATEYGEAKNQRFMISPEEVLKDGKPDFLWGNYIKAKKAFKDHFGEWPDKGKEAFQVAEYLRTVPVLVDTRAGDDGPFVVNIRSSK